MSMDLNNIDDLKQQAPTLAAIGNLNPFTVPNGYFESLQEHLMSRAALGEVIEEGGFNVPSGYFEDFSSNLNSRIALEALSSEKGFTVPDAYFETLSSQIESRIFSETLKEEHASDGFAVPAGYFENLQERINSKIEVKRPTAKIISLRSFVQYAAAACITITIGAGIYLSQPKPVAQSQQVLLASIPDDEIVSYLQLHSDIGDTPTIVENLDNKSSDLPNISEELSEQELQQYIDANL